MKLFHSLLAGAAYAGSIYDCEWDSPNHATIAEVMAQLNHVKNVVSGHGQWAIIGLADNTSIHGEGYSWEIQDPHTSKPAWEHLGGHLCIPKECPAGYSGPSCLDTDECALGTDGCDHTCTNHVGGFTCSCYYGYAISGTTCIEIDECADGTHGCDQNCHNTDGGYTCSCNSGYVSNMHGDGKSCIDVNECDGAPASICHPLFGVCENRPGSYTCRCADGYVGDGMHCEEGLPYGPDCVDIFPEVEKTNSWTCRDCFNLRVNFDISGFNWDRYVYLSFTEETAIVQFAGPVAAIEFDGNDFNGNFRYRVRFISRFGEEFGDDRVDFNAEFRELGNKPRLQWAWACGVEKCAPITNPHKISGNGDWACSMKRNGKTTSCKAVCGNGKNPKGGSTRARCSDNTDFTWAFKNKKGLSAANCN